MTNDLALVLAFSGMALAAASFLIWVVVQARAGAGVNWRRWAPELAMIPGAWGSVVIVWASGGLEHVTPTGQLGMAALLIPSALAGTYLWHRRDRERRSR